MPAIPPALTAPRPPCLCARYRAHPPHSSRGPLRERISRDAACSHQPQALFARRPTGLSPHHSTTIIIPCAPNFNPVHRYFTSNRPFPEHVEKHAALPINAQDPKRYTAQHCRLHKAPFGFPLCLSEYNPFSFVQGALQVRSHQINTPCKSCPQITPRLSFCEKQIPIWYAR